ncbi:MAG: DnaB-like helicase N-terminal domain-containing protein, partial [Cyanobacteriota bacterium]
MVSVPLSSQAPGPEEETGSRSSRRGRQRDEANFEAMPDGVPPQNLEAEEAVLGGILLDPDAIGRVADVLQPEA